jgi:hypothetical protein
MGLKALRAEHRMYLPVSLPLSSLAYLLPSFFSHQWISCSPKISYVQLPALWVSQTVVAHRRARSFASSSYGLGETPSHDATAIPWGADQGLARVASYKEELGRVCIRKCLYNKAGSEGLCPRVSVRGGYCAMMRRFEEGPSGARAA